MPTNSKEYMNAYMKAYVKRNREKVICEHCKGTFLKYNKYIHQKSKKHQIVMEILSKTCNS